MGEGDTDIALTSIYTCATKLCYLLLRKLICNQLKTQFVVCCFHGNAHKTSLQVMQLTIEILILFPSLIPILHTHIPSQQVGLGYGNLTLTQQFFNI